MFWGFVYKGFCGPRIVIWFGLLKVGFIKFTAKGLNLAFQNRYYDDCPDYNMNNFYENLPLGSYRVLMDERGYENRASVMISLDILLRFEHKTIDTTGIYQAIREANKASVECRGKPDLYAHADRLAEEAGRRYEELRPVFNQLVKMGHDPLLLSR